MLVALTDPIEPAGEAILRAAGHETTLPQGGDEAALRALCAAADAVIVRRKLPDDLVEASPRLLAAVRHGVGVDLIPVERCTARGVLVANVPGANADAVAEFAVAQMLAIARHAEAMHTELSAAGWDTARARAGAAAELTGKTLGIVGVGAIGARLAEIAHHGFRMRVLGYRRNPAGLPPYVTAADLPILFAESDYVALACPLTEATRGLASAALLARMKPGAWLLNVSRGAVVDEDALLAALRQRRIGGAALDVYAVQPLAPDHPLRSLPNVLLTPHAAGLTRESMEQMSTVSAEEVVRVLRGERPRNFINPEVWPAAQARRRALGHAMPEGAAP
jgi:D-3-phosphoglycerate dehydrogenase